jgi:O-antigen ligase
MVQYRGRTARSWLVWGALVASTFAVAGGAVLIANGDPVVGLAIVGFTAVLVWMFLPAKPATTPKWITLFVLSLVFSTVLPSAVSSVIQVIAIAGSFLYWLRLSPTERRGKAVVIWAALVIGYWAILIFHPNVPGLDAGVLGFRKTVLCVAGVVAGASISRALLPAVERTVVKILGLGILVSIALHLFAPSIEASIGRTAGQYTALLGGEARLQGVFSGPFHVALGGLLLIGWALVRLKTQPRLATIVLLIGGAGTYLSLVRTAYVALLLVVLVIIFMAPSFAKFARRIVAATVAGLVALTVLASVNPSVLAVLESVAQFSTDTRFQGRFPGYQKGIEMLQVSPLFGWGSGSAGDTLQAYFNAGQHITSHNIVLKIAVEGGLIGLALWVGLFVSIVRRLDRTNPLSAVAAASLAALIGMGLTVASLEALPMSFFAFLLVGLALEHSPMRRLRRQPERALSAPAPTPATVR